MGLAEDNFLFSELLDLTFWADTLMHCRDVRKWSTADNSNYLFGQFTVSTVFKSPRSWFLCYDNIDYLENIMHYLHLNVSFVQQIVISMGLWVGIMRLILKDL